ncbi:hypothetical protein SteCoe_30233 [Stentor coeruleus]|uniref:Ribose 5-phosphate isomerase B n=1 Tax=Stentor coeruleus TaxID=5963 RepID=A0A1R2B414_9CILI|nr:hypothetical protein SteCoe_30233 [Stentor coeruleus]
MDKPRIVFASDHAGFQYKSILSLFLESKGYTILDVGCTSAEPTDFPIYAKLGCEKIINKEAELGVFICGSGIGISIAANRYNGIRCAVCHDYFTATNCRLKDHANVIALGERVLGIEVAKQMVEAFVATVCNMENPDYGRRAAMIDSIMDNE